MIEPNYITFTGADDRTDPASMVDLAKDYPVEWGILFSGSRQGMEPRYPSLPDRLVLHRGYPLTAFSAHLCGGHARNVMMGIPPMVPISLSFFSRVQINHRNPVPERVAATSMLVGRGICQTRDPLQFPTDSSVDWLYDCSGGNGTLAEEWPVHPGRLVGYAGGITPENVKDVLTAIGATGPYWIDMESGVRTDDWFDLAKCRKVCEAVYG